MFFFRTTCALTSRSARDHGDVAASVQVRALLCAASTLRTHIAKVRRETMMDRSHGLERLRDVATYCLLFREDNRSLRAHGGRIRSKLYIVRTNMFLRLRRVATFCSRVPRRHSHATRGGAASYVNYPMLGASQKKHFFIIPDWNNGQ